MRCNSLPRLSLASAVCLISLLGITQAIPAAAQGSLRDRITATVSSSASVAIPDTVHPRVKLATDLGPTPADTKLNMSIRFNLTAAQQAALDQLLADQQNPSSPRYHQWLTPAQFAAQFGLSTGDTAKVSAWLSSQGFTVTGVANGGSFITFTGTVAQAQSAFSTSIHNLTVNGENHYANITDIQLPSAIAGVVTTVTGLHNFRAKPRVHTSVVNPKYTDSSTGDHYLAPGDIDTIYDVNPLHSSGYVGTGITIAVTGQVDIYPADIAAFRTASGLSAINLTTVHAAGVDPGPPECNSCSYEANEGDLMESSIDLEWSGAMAPSANILFVNALCALPGTGCGTDAMTDAIDSDLATIVTTSYGDCEAGWGTADLTSTNALFKQASAQGQTVLAAAADQGATDCDGGATAEYGLNVDFPGSSPYVTSMGGTQFNEGTATGTTQYWNSNSSSGTANAGSAVSYIPEAVWNDESALGGFNFDGGGGGPSAFFTKPAWQVGTPADAARDVPDLSLNASDAHDDFLYCVNVALGESCTSGFSVASGTYAGTLNLAGGTSFDSQIFGGMLAVLEQKIVATTGLGNINPKLYAFGNNATYYTPGATIATNPSVVFNDITTGNNAMPCVTGTPDCGNGGSIGFSASPGYDEASGWGSVNLNNLAADWTQVTALGSGSLGTNLSTTSLTANGSSTGATVTSGAAVTLTATVSGGSGAAPTGTVVFLANNVAIGSQSVSSISTTTATASFTWNTSCNNLGQQVITASYSGDSNYQGSIGPPLSSTGAAPTPVEVLVNTNACPDFSLAASGTGVVSSGSNATVAVAAGGTIPNVVITATPVNSFVGTVTFSATITSTTGYVPTLTFNPTLLTFTSANNTVFQTTTLTFSGITADLRLPVTPGKVDSGTMLARRSSGNTPWYAAGSGVTIASLLLFTLPRRRRLGGLLLLVLSVALIGAASGCGSSSQAGPPSSSGNSNSEAGIYTVTVTGSYTSGSHTTIHTSVITYSIN